MLALRLINATSRWHWKHNTRQSESFDDFNWEKFLIWTQLNRISDCIIRFRVGASTMSAACPCRTFSWDYENKKKGEKCLKANEKLCLILRIEWKLGEQKITEIVHKAATFRTKSTIAGYHSDLCGCSICWISSHQVSLDFKETFPKTRRERTQRCDHIWCNDAGITRTISHFWSGMLSNEI